MMAVEYRDDLKVAAELAGFGDKSALVVMHLTEIEEESENVLDLLTALRAHAHHSDVDASQESLAELTIAFEHLQHHLGDVLPEVQTLLEIESD